MKEHFAKFIKTNLGAKTLLITCGLPGTWKTETAEEVSKIKGYPILRSDIIRLEVLKNEDVFDPKVAGNMSKRLSVYDEVFRRADELAGKIDGGIDFGRYFCYPGFAQAGGASCSKTQYGVCNHANKLPSGSFCCKN